MALLRQYDARQRIIVEAREWVGTPYHRHGRIKGVGVDCAMLLAEVFERVGVISHLDAGFYAHDWHLHRSEELFIDWLKRVGAQQVPVPLFGDIGLWQYGRTYSHGGIVVDDREPQTIVHSYLEQGVIQSKVSEQPLSGRSVQWWSMWW